MPVVEKAGFQIARQRAGVWNDVFREQPILSLAFTNLERANETPHIFQSAKLFPDSRARKWESRPSDFEIVESLVPCFRGDDAVKV